MERSMKSLHELRPQVHKLKTEIINALSESVDDHGLDGQRAAFAALTELTTEFGLLLVGPENTSRILKEMRLKVIQLGRTLK
jgi:hypothetical protein